MLFEISLMSRRRIERTSILATIGEFIVRLLGISLSLLGLGPGQLTAFSSGGGWRSVVPSAVSRDLTRSASSFQPPVPAYPLNVSLRTSLALKKQSHRYPERDPSLPIMSDILSDRSP